MHSRTIAERESSREGSHSDAEFCNWYALTRSGVSTTCGCSLYTARKYSLLFLTSLLFPRTFKTDMFLILPQHWVRPESFDFVFTACLISQLTVPASPKIRSQFWLFMFDSQPQGWHTPQESSHQCHAWGFVHNKSACKQAVHQTVGSCTHLVSDTCATLVADGFDNDPAWSAAT